MVEERKRRGRGEREERRCVCIGWLVLGGGSGFGKERFSNWGVDDYKEEDEEEDGFGGVRERRSLVNGVIIL